MSPPPIPAWPSAGTTAVNAAVERLLEQRLAAVSVRTPAFAQALRAYRSAVVAGDSATADALAAWLGGQPHVAAAAKRSAGIRGELDHFGAMGFLQGLLEVLRDAGHPGLLLVLDEVETLQRVRGDVRDKAFNALRQLLDEIDAGRYPGLFLVITGTAAVLRRPERRAAGCRRWRSAWPPISPPIPGSTTRARSSSGCPDSTARPCSPSAPRSVTSTRTGQKNRTGSSRPWTMPTSASWPMR